MVVVKNKIAIIHFITLLFIVQSSVEKPNHPTIHPCDIEPRTRINTRTRKHGENRTTETSMKKLKKNTLHARIENQICNISFEELIRIFGKLHIEKYYLGNETNSTEHVYSTDFLKSLKQFLKKATEHKPHDNKTNIEKLLSKSQTLDVLAVIANSSSVICLLILLLTFHLFKELRTIPGQYLIHLAVFLAFGHFMLIMGIYAKSDEQFCSIIGILTHWTYLTVFSFTAAISCDVVRTFSSPVKIPRNSESLRRFQLLRATALFTPVLIVSPCIALHFNGNAKDMYGSGGSCFVTNDWANLFAFVTPVGVTLLYNTVCIAVTIFTIHKTQRRTSSVLGRRNSANRLRLKALVLTVKLATVTGFGWVFGYVAALTNVNLFQIAFVLLYSFQGTCVFVGFTWRRRILALYRRRWSRPYHEFKQGTTKNTKVAELTLRQLTP
eukprot:gene10006-11030_t